MGKVLRLFMLSALFMCWLSVASADANTNAFRTGDQGTQVAEIQGELANLGYDVVADGDFGLGTQEAVKEFQNSVGIAADGLVGPQTYQALMGRNMPQVSRGSNYFQQRVINTSFQYIGVPYVFGGTSPSGFDCSGFTSYVFANAGIALPRTADAQYEVGTPVSYDELQKGDLVFFSTYTYGASHVGIYIGDGKFINASTSRGVAIDSLNSGYWSSTYIGARRVI